MSVISDMTVSSRDTSTVEPGAEARGAGTDGAAVVSDVVVDMCGARAEPEAVARRAELGTETTRTCGADGEPRKNDPTEAGAPVGGVATEDEAPVEVAVEPVEDTEPDPTGGSTRFEACPRQSWWPLLLVVFAPSSLRLWLPLSPSPRLLWFVLEWRRSS